MSDKPRIPDASHVSEAVRAANPHLYPQQGAKSSILPAQDGAGIVLTTKSTKDSGKQGCPRGRAPMNKTEARFAAILEAKVRRGDIVSFEREGITLRWPDGMTYTADFSVAATIRTTATEAMNDCKPHVALVFIEVKGAHIREDALVKFRAARAHWTLYRFEMWQWKGGEWSQIL